MRSLLSAVLWRYVAIIVQFGIVLLVTHRTALNVAGQYFGYFGLVSVSFTLVGLGAPDGLVRYLPRYVSAGNASGARQMIGSTTVGSIAICLATGSLFVAVALVITNYSTITVLLIASWWLGYCLVFLAAQIVLGLTKPSLGSFVAYSLINFGYLIVQVPYLLLARRVSLTALLTNAVLATYLAVIISAILVHKSLPLRREKAETEETAPASFSGMLKTGFPMMLSRLIQASLPWIPTWILLINGFPTQAAIYAAASRLTVAVTSVVAALRFSVRPQIVILSEALRFDELALLSRRCSGLATLPPLSAIVFLGAAGNYIVPLILGPRYSSSSDVLLVLMLGVLAEAFGGPSDEILKMTGRTKIVLLSLMSAVTVEILLALTLAASGAAFIAVAVATAFVIEYGCQVSYLTFATPIRIYPISRSRTFKVGAE